MSKIEPLPDVRRRSLLARPVTWLAVSVVALGVVGAHLFSRRGESVDVVLVTRRSLAQRLVATGRVLAPSRVELGSTVLGRVVEVPVTEGTAVEAGELIVRLDDSVARAEVQQARAEVAAARARVGVIDRVSSQLSARTVDERTASFERAERDWQRARQLHAEGALPDAELDAARTAFDVARSQLEAARAELQSNAPGGGARAATVATVAQAEAALAVAEARLQATRIEAPAAGVVLERGVEPGDVVSPGATVAVLLGRGATRLSALVDEKYLGVLTLRQRATVVADALPERPFPAALAWIAPAVDAGRGTVELRFSVAKPPVELRPDQTVSLNLDVTRREATLSLPPSAVRDAAGDAPWALVVAGDRLERRALRLGIRGDDRLEVLAGVTEGEPVVLGARVTLGPGARVRPRVVEAPGG